MEEGAQARRESSPAASDTATHLNLAQAARYLGYHRQTLKGFIDRGRVPAIHLGREYRILVADLDRLRGYLAPAVGNAAAAESRATLLRNRAAIDRALAQLEEAG